MEFPVSSQNLQLSPIFLDLASSGQIDMHTISMVSRVSRRGLVRKKDSIFTLWQGY